MTKNLIDTGSATIGQPFEGRVSVPTEPRQPAVPIDDFARPSLKAAENQSRAHRTKVSLRRAAVPLQPKSGGSRWRRAMAVGFIALGGGINAATGVGPPPALTLRFRDIDPAAPSLVPSPSAYAGTYSSEPAFEGAAAHTWAAKAQVSDRPGARTLLDDNAQPYVNPLCVDLPNIVDGMWLMKRHGILEVCNVSTKRAQDVVHVLDIVSRDHPEIPEFDPALVCSRDVIAECSAAMPNGTIPGRVTLAFGRDSRQPAKAHGQTVILVPDCVFWGWEEVGIASFERTAAEMRRAGRQPAERDVAGWVGNPKTNPFRYVLVNMTAQYPDDIEAIAMDWQPSKDGSQQLSWTQGGMTLPDQVKRWKYLVDVPGNGYSFRVKLFFHTLRTLIWQEQPWLEWYYPMLKPWEHYVPFAADGSDLLDKIRWAKDNPDKATTIAYNAAHFARRHLTRARAVERWAEVLNHVARLQKEPAAMHTTHEQLKARQA